jgi:hypothetical protein
LGIEPGKHLGKHRNHKDIQNDNRHGHRNQHKYGVPHGLFDAFTHIPLKLQVFVQAQEHFGQPPGHFTNPDHRNVEATKQVLVACHGGRQFAALVQAGADVFEQIHHGWLGGRGLQARKSPQNGHTGLVQGVHLAREDHQVFIHNGLAVDLGPPTLGVCLRLWLWPAQYAPEQHQYFSAGRQLRFRSWPPTGR